MIRMDKSFIVEADEREVRQRLRSYMEQAGYRAGPMPDTYTRGTKLGTLVAFSPNKLFSTVTAQLKRTLDWTTAVELSFRVSTTGQLVMPSDHKYWQAEMDALEASLNGAISAPGELQQTNRAATKTSVVGTLILIACAAIGAALGLAAGKTASAGWVGLFLGIFAGGIFLQWYRQRQARHARASASPTATAEALKPTASLQDVFTRDIRSWGVWLIVMGLLSVLESGVLSSSWGIMLILLGAGSFIFRTPALYIVYGITLGWAAITNGLLSSGATEWRVFALLQAFLAVQIFMKYRRFNRAYQAGAAGALPAPQVPGETDLVPETLAPDPYAGFFPWLSLGLGMFGFFGLLASIVGQIIFYEVNPSVANVLQFIFEVALNFCIIGFACGLGALLTRHRFKGASIAAMSFGGLGTLLVAALILMP